MHAEELTFFHTSLKVCNSLYLLENSNVCFLRKNSHSYFSTRQSNALLLALNRHFPSQKHLPPYQTKHCNQKLQERNHLLCLLLKYEKKVNTHKAKLCT